MVFRVKCGNLGFRNC